MGDDERPSTPAAPKLTFTQRILTALPRVGGSASADAPPPSPDAGVGVDHGTEADHEVERTGDHEAERAGDTAAERAGGQKAKGAAAGSDKTRQELAHSIKYVDDRERRIGMFMAPLGVAIGIAFLVVAMRLHPNHLAKNQVSQATEITLGIAIIIMSVVVLLAALSRRRAFLGFALVFLGIPMQFPLLLPFWFVGGWLVFRSLKWQRQLAAMNPNAARGRAGGRGATTRPDPRARGREAAKARSAKKQPAPKGPPPSKRYTPPKPTRPRPPAPPS